MKYQPIELRDVLAALGEARMFLIQQDHVIADQNRELNERRDEVHHLKIQMMGLTEENQHLKMKAETVTIKSQHESTTDLEPIEVEELSDRVQPKIIHPFKKPDPALFLSSPKGK